MRWMDPSTAGHLPFVPEKNLCLVKDMLASSQIELHAKSSEQKQHIPIPSDLAHVNFLQLLS